MSSLSVIRRPYINIGTTKRVYYDELDLNEIDLEDLALALSHENRFGGHTSRPYSVLEHLLLCDWLYRRECAENGEHVYPELRLALLMHDAHEALCKDIPSPMKKLLPEYQALEARMEAAVWARFGVDQLMDGHARTIKYYDLRALNTERKHFQFEPDGDADWPSNDTWAPANMADFLWDTFHASPPQAATREAGLRLMWVRTVKFLNPVGAKATS